MSIRPATRPLLLACIALVAACNGSSDDKYDSDTESSWWGDDATESETEGWWDSDTETWDTETDWASDTEDTDTDTEDEEETETDTEDDEETDTDTPDCTDADDVVLYLSPDDSNSMTSPMLVRARQEKGGYIGSSILRAYEFMNFFSFDYDPPSESGTVALDAQLVEESEVWRLQVGVTAEDVALDERAPLNLTFVVDTSCSMSGTPMSATKASMRTIAGLLDEGDVVSMVTWSSSAATELDSHAITGPDDSKLLAVIDDLASGGGTDLHGGLVSGYELAEDNYDPEYINRMILISDGGANLGVTSAEVIAAKAEAVEGAEGIYLMGIGAGGVNSYNDALMDEVTDAGKGAAMFIADSDVAERYIDEDRFVSLFDVAVRDVKLELTLPPGFTIVRSSAEKVSSDPTEVQDQHLAPNDSMVFYNELETACPDAVDPTASITATVTFTDAEGEAQEVEQTWLVSDLIAGDTAELLKGEAVFATVEALRLGDATVEKAAQEAIDAAREALPDDEEIDWLQSYLDGSW